MYTFKGTKKRSLKQTAKINGDLFPDDSEDLEDEEPDWSGYCVT